MFYICVENGVIINVFNYEPSVPETVTVTEITDEEYNNVKNKTHYFDVESQTILAYEQDYIAAEEAKAAQEQINMESRSFLYKSDWKVLRHIREQALGQPTSLTAEEYLELEQARADAAAAIVEQPVPEHRFQ